MWGKCVVFFFLFPMKGGDWHVSLSPSVPSSLSVVTALVRSWRVSIISTSMILCTETSRWVAARFHDNHTLTHVHTHTHTSARGHGNIQMALSCSISLPLPLRNFCSTAVYCPRPPLSVVRSVILPVLDRDCVCFCVCACIITWCMFVLSTEMLSHDHVEGFVSPMARTQELIRAQAHSWGGCVWAEA